MNVWQLSIARMHVCLRLQRKRGCVKLTHSLYLIYLFVFLDEGVGLGVAEVFGFVQVFDAFCLVTFQTLGQTFEEVAIAVVAVKLDALVGCLDGLIIHADSYLKG